MDTILSQIGTPLTCPVAVIIREGKILLGHRHYTADKWKDISVWTVPGGRCDGGETIGETLLREVYEETGIRDITFERYLGEVPGAKDGDVVPMFLASTSEEPRLMEPEKFSEWSWHYISRIPEDFINEHARKVILEI